MGDPTKEASDNSQKVLVAKILQFFGLFDIGLGVVVVLEGPSWVPDIDVAWWIVGVGNAVIGMVLIVYGHVLKKRLQPRDRTVVR